MFITLPDKLYNVLKWIAMLFMPALAILVQTIFKIWNLPFGSEITATIVALNAFLSMILGISSIGYQQNLKKK